jgi:hypothetical protein
VSLKGSSRAIHPDYKWENIKEYLVAGVLILAIN